MSRTGNSWRALAFLGLVLSGCVEGRGALLETAAQPAQELVTVYPREIDDVLYNPGMGVADFHFGFGHPPTVEEYPRATVAYFRWPWAELEPAEGQYNLRWSTA